MNYFYDQRDNVLKAETDESKCYVIAWAEKGCVTKFRILKLTEMATFYNYLNSSYSRVIFNYPPSGSPWVVFEGPLGLRADSLIDAIKGSDWTEEHYAVLINRSASGFRMNILPKSLAEIEYQNYKPITGLTKMLVSIRDGKVLDSLGEKTQDCKNFYNKHIDLDEFDF